MRLIEAAQRRRGRRAAWRRLKHGRVARQQAADGGCLRGPARGVRPARGLRTVRDGGSTPGRPRCSPKTSPGRPRTRARDWRDMRVRRVRDADDPDFAAAYERLFARVRPARRDGDARGDRRSARVGSGAAASAARRSPTSCWCCAAAARSRRCAITRPWCASTRAAGRVAGRVVVHLSHAYVEPAHRGTGSPRWLRALPLQAARRCARRGRLRAGARRSCSSRRWSRPIRRRAERMPRLRSYERAGFRKIDPGRGALRAARLPRARACWRGAVPRPVPLGLVRAPRRARARERDAGGRGRRRSSRRSTRSTACTCRPRRSIRCAPPRRDWTARQPTLPPATTDGVITAYHHPGFAAPIGDHVMPMRKFQLVADGARGARWRARRGAGADRDASELAPRPHAGVRRRGAHRRAARARRVAEVPVVAGALAVGAADQRRRARGRRRARSTTASPPRSRAASTTAHADHGEGFCTFNGLVVAAEALRAAGRARDASPCSTSICTTATARRRCARRALALQLLDLRQRLLAEQALPRRRDDAAPRTAPTTSRSRCRTAAAATTLLEALERGMAAILAYGPPGSGALPGRRGSVPRGSVLAARSRSRRSARARPRRSSRGRSARRCRSPGCWRAATRRDVSKVVEVHLGTFDAPPRSTASRGAAVKIVASRCSRRWTGFVLLFFYLPIAIWCCSRSTSRG